MRHLVLCRLAALLAAAWTMAAPHPAVAAPEGPGSPGETIGSTPTPTSVRPAASDAAAPNDPASARPKRDTYPFRGIVASVDPSAMTLILEGKQAKRVIRVLPQTRIEKDGSPLPLEALKAGESVGGTLRRTPEGREEALLIRIGSKPEASPSGDGTRPKRKARNPSPG